MLMGVSHHCLIASLLLSIIAPEFADTVHLTRWNMSLLSSALLEISWRNAFLGYACIELSFYACYRWVLLPRAQLPVNTRPTYRDYNCPVEDRIKLFQRICHRLERQAQQEPHNDFRQQFSNFLLEWFRPTNGAQAHNTTKPPPLLRAVTSSSSSTDVSGDEDNADYGDCNNNNNRQWTIPGVKKAEMDDFFAWAFFEKETNLLEISERLGMQKMYDLLLRDYGLKFEPGRGSLVEGRRLTLDEIQSVHRPLIVYIILHFLERVGNVLLRLFGFQRYSAKSGLVYWHRTGLESEKRLPLLFFHGVAPAGKTFYLPMCLLGLGDRQRNLYLFENRSISSTDITFDVLSEDDTVAGVEEALRRHGDDARSLSLCGHSFGSCAMTWLLHSSLRDNIHQFVLMDPVTILLSEANVMVNFLYARNEVSTNIANHYLAGIQYVGSELFTEYYLRRNFSWYNAELWLDDLPKSAHVLVCLCEEDQILSAPNVKREIESHGMDNLDLIYLKGVDHADCILNPKSWPQLRTAMLAQESSILLKKCT